MSPDSIEHSNTILDFWVRDRNCLRLSKTQFYLIYKFKRLKYKILLTECHIRQQWWPFRDCRLHHMNNEDWPVDLLKNNKIQIIPMPLGESMFREAEHRFAQKAIGIIYYTKLEHIFEILYSCFIISLRYF